MYGVVVAGLGRRGCFWLEQLAWRKDVKLLAAAEPDAGRRSQAIASGLLEAERAFPSLEAALDAFPPDYVLDVTPPGSHAAVAEAAFARGLHLLGEKPLADDLTTARRIAARGAAVGRRHMIAQNYRFRAAARALRRSLDAGIIGPVGQCDVRFAKPWADAPGSHYVTGPYMLLNDMMVHHFDLLRYFLGSEPLWVQAVTWNHPWGWHAGDAAHSVVFGFPAGVMATHVCCGCAVGSQTSWNGDWRLEGPQGSLDWIGDSLTHHHLHRTTNPSSRPIDTLQRPAAEQAVLDEFHAAVREDRETECSAVDHLRTLEMVFAAIRSAHEERRVRLSELQETDSGRRAQPDAASP